MERFSFLACPSFEDNLPHLVYAAVASGRKKQKSLSPQRTKGSLPWYHLHFAPGFATAPDATL
jgi:hypothetical protein